MYSVCDDLTAGFPHSEICGSKRVCSLPAAYRKLLRPSSPVIAKASTICTYSLDPITLKPEPFLAASVSVSWLDEPYIQIPQRMSTSAIGVSKATFLNLQGCTD